MTPQYTKRIGLELPADLYERVKPHLEKQSLTALVIEALDLWLQRAGKS